MGQNVASSLSTTLASDGASNLKRVLAVPKNMLVQLFHVKLSVRPVHVMRFSEFTKR